MPDTTFLDWPFFEARHRALAEQLDEFARTKLAELAHGASDDASLDRACREIVHRLGAEGFLNQCCVTEPGGKFDVRSLALSRETLARHGGLADFCFAMQGLGTGPISLFGTEAQKRKYLPPVMRGKRIAAFALSEPQAGSDVSAIATEAARLGVPGEGFRIAMATLDVFRTTVGAAALGFARRALDEALARCRERAVFGKPLAEYQLTQAKIAEMALAVDAAALLVYRAAWTKDVLGKRVTREAAMAKLYATEAAQQVIDMAVQLHGGAGVVSGAPVERLYREIRALRIYEGTSEIQKLVVASAV